MLKNIITIMLLIFIGTIIWISNFRGYCAKDGKVLSDEELIKIVAGRIYEDNHDCCYVEDGASRFENLIERIINRLFGYYNYSIIMYYPCPECIDDPYYNKYLTVSACGNVRDEYGITISKTEYASYIEYVKKIKNKKKDN